MNKDTTSQAELFCIIIAEFINREIEKFHCKIRDIHVERDNIGLSRRLCITVEMLSSPNRFSCNISCHADHWGSYLFTTKTLRKKSYIKELSSPIVNFIEKNMEKLSFNKLQYELVNFFLKENLYETRVDGGFYINHIDIHLYHPEIIKGNIILYRCEEPPKVRIRNVPIMIFTNKYDFSKSVTFKILFQEIRNALTNHLDEQTTI